MIGFPPLDRSPLPVRYDDIFDGLEVIMRGRGRAITQGDILMAAAAIKALRARSEYCIVCHPRPSEQPKEKP